MQETPWQEKRRLSRIRGNLPLRYELRPEGKYGNTVTKDVSEGGLRIVLDHYIPKLSQMLLQLNLSSAKIVDLTGNVTWSQRIPNSYRYESGIKFTNINSQTRKEIEEYVSTNRLLQR